MHTAASLLHYKNKSILYLILNLYMCFFFFPGNGGTVAHLENSGSLIINSFVSRLCLLLIPVKSKVDHFTMNFGLDVQACGIKQNK